MKNTFCLTWLKAFMYVTVLALAFVGGILLQSISPTQNVAPSQPNCEDRTKIIKLLHRDEMEQAYDVLLFTQIRLVRAMEELKIYNNLGEEQ